MSKRRTWLVALGAIALLLIGVLVPVLHWLGGSNNGTVHVGTSAQQVAPTETATIVKTPYFSTQLLPGFTIKRQTATPAGQMTLLQLFATTSSTTDKEFAATVGVLPADGLSGIGDYNLRATQIATYQRYTPANLPLGAVAFRTVSGPAAFTVFWPHGTWYVELAYSTDGGASLSQLESVFNQTIASWQWN